MSELDPWPAGQLCHARTRAITAAFTVLAGVGAAGTGATLAVYANPVAGLVLAVAGLTVLVAGFELAGRWVDGNGPTRAEACFVAAFLPLGGWRPAGRSPAEAPGRPVGGSTKSNTTLSPSPSTNPPGKGVHGAFGAVLGKSRIKVSPPPPRVREQRKRGLGKPSGGER